MDVSRLSVLMGGTQTRPPSSDSIAYLARNQTIWTALMLLCREFEAAVVEVGENDH